MAKKIEAKEKAAKAKKRAAGRGIEGKYVYSMRDVAKYVENDPLFENVNLMLLQGYVWKLQLCLLCFTILLTAGGVGLV